MDKDYGIGHCRLHRVQLSPLKRNIARMGGSRHRVFQGILQVFILNSLPAGSGGYTFLHSQLSGFLKIQTYEADIPYRSKYHLAEQGCPFGRLFLFPMPYGNENDEDTHGKDREAHTAIDRP